MNREVRDRGTGMRLTMQTWFDFEQDIISTAIDQWHDRLTSGVCAGGGHLEHVFFNERSFI